MLEGPSLDLYKTIIEACSNANSTQSIKLIASGGVSQVQDLIDLKDIGCEGVIIGKALYEDRISLKDLERFIVKN
jgi:phosphoribosylformimino-5-aminoimidazole carboxamide ribotide isomerase